MNKSIHIILVESASLIIEGLTSILNKSGLNYQISYAETLEEIELICIKKKCDIIIVNPSLIQNNVKFFNTLKYHLKTIKWVGLVYAYCDPKILSIFDTTITISDTSETVGVKINALLADSSYKREQNLSQEILSDREIDVLKLLATGMSNKEIADKLNISTNTVITHRKNISQKTGIKSVSGLTIYAVMQKFVSIDSLSE